MAESKLHENSKKLQVLCEIIAFCYQFHSPTPTISRSLSCCRSVNRTRMPLLHSFFFFFGRESTWKLQKCKTQLDHSRLWQKRFWELQNMIKKARKFYHWDWKIVVFLYSFYFLSILLLYKYNHFYILRPKIAAWLWLQCHPIDLGSCV